MRVACFDHLSGLTGPMLLGALIDVGADEKAIQHALASIPPGSATLMVQTRLTPGGPTRFAESAFPEAPPFSGYSDTLQWLENSPWSVRGRRIWSRLGAATAFTRGQPPDTLDFVGMDGTQTLGYIVGVCAALVDLNIGAIHSVPLPFVSSTDPPGSLLARLAVGAVIRDMDSGPVDAAGMAILSAIVDAYAWPERLHAQGFGQGASPETGALLRVCVGERPEEEPESPDHAVMILETQIDDMNPQLYPHIVERLLESGAMDAFLTPVIMKKGRPGVLLTALAPVALTDALSDLILQETTTIGLRRYRADRRVLPRRMVTVETPYGAIRVKVVRHGQGTRCAPEYEDCVSASMSAGIALSAVYVAARAAADALDLDALL